MARTRDVKRKVFDFIPPEDIITWDLEIDSVSVKTVIWNAEFTRAICPEIGFFKVVLDNNNGEFNEKYSGNEVVEFFIDRASGTTTRFKGQIDTIKNSYDSGKGYNVIVSGYHVSGELMGDIHVTESYAKDSTTVDDILKDIIDTYLTGYTYTNVGTSTEKPEINWDNKTFWECVFDLCKLAKSDVLFDCYVDDDKDFHFFEEKTVSNSDEAIVWNYNLISAPVGLGNQSLTKKDKIRVIGEAGGLPVLSTAGTGSKEEIIFDSKIITTDLADEVSSATLSLKNQTPREGEGMCFQLQSLSPGDFIWYTNPPQKITEQVKIYKYTHTFPNENTKYWIQTSREIPHIFKKRIETELALQTITNPFKMTSSWNFVFDSEDEITTKDSNVKIEDGIIKLSSGTEGTSTAIKTVTTAVTKVHLKVIGSALVGTVYKFSTDGGDSTVTLTPDVEITVPSGTNLWFKVFINSAETEIDAAAVLSR